MVTACKILLGKLVSESVKCGIRCIFLAARAGFVRLVARLGTGRCQALVLYNGMLVLSRLITGKLVKIYRQIITANKQ